MMKKILGFCTYGKRLCGDFGLARRLAVMRSSPERLIVEWLAIF